MNNWLSQQNIRRVFVLITFFGYFLALPPTTTGIRTRVETGDEAVSLGLPCVTDMQCRIADPSSKCIEGICDCVIRNNGTRGCSARNRGCIPGTFQVKR